MSLTGLIILALVVIFISLPPLLLVGKLINRKPTPEEFKDTKGNILLDKGEEHQAWRRCQTCYTILAYFVAISCILFFSAHILVMSLVMGEKTTDLWLNSLLITFILDYVFLQTSKGIILMCCLSEGCVDLVLTVFAGALL